MIRNQANRSAALPRAQSHGATTADPLDALRPPVTTLGLGDRYVSQRVGDTPHPLAEATHVPTYVGSDAIRALSYVVRRFEQP